VPFFVQDVSAARYHRHYNHRPRYTHWHYYLGETITIVQHLHHPCATPVCASLVYGGPLLYLCFLLFTILSLFACIPSLIGCNPATSGMDSCCMPPEVGHITSVESSQNLFCIFHLYLRDLPTTLLGSPRVTISQAVCQCLIP